MIFIWERLKTFKIHLKKSPLKIIISLSNLIIAFLCQQSISLICLIKIYSFNLQKEIRPQPAPIKILFSWINKENIKCESFNIIYILIWIFFYIFFPYFYFTLTCNNIICFWNKNCFINIIFMCIFYYWNIFIFFYLFNSIFLLKDHLMILKNYFHYLYHMKEFLFHVLLLSFELLLNLYLVF